MRTERLLLRPFQADDVGAALQYRDDAAFARFLPHIPPPFTRADAERFVTGNMAEPWEQFATFAIELDARLIGTVNLDVARDLLMRWQLTEGLDLTAEPIGDQVLDYSHTSYQAGATVVAGIFGVVYAPEVTMVEAAFDAGQVVRGDVKQGRFVLVARGAASARELRALDADGRVVERFEVHRTAPSTR